MLVKRSPRKQYLCMFSELGARITPVLSHLCNGAKNFLIVKSLYKETRVPAYKFLLSQSLNRGNMVNMTKTTSLHTQSKAICRVCHIGSGQSSLWENPCTTYIFKIMSIKFLSQKWLCYSRGSNTSKINHYSFTELHSGQTIVGKHPISGIVYSTPRGLFKTIHKYIIKHHQYNKICDRCYVNSIDGKNSKDLEKMLTTLGMV